MDTDYFLTLMESFDPTLPVFIATDEVQRDWFEPIAARFNISFVEDLAQPPLLLALAAFPQPLWPDVLAMMEQIVIL